MAEATVIYVDGACRNNGHSNPQGGCGVYWGPYHPMNASEELIGEKQTNNCAELSAAIIALMQCKVLNISAVEIQTDSKYVKDGITKWITTWKANSWKLVKGNSNVLNRELWELLDKLRSEITVSWKWVEAHKNSEGNIRADELAKDGISSKCYFWQQQANIQADETSPKQIETENQVDIQAVNDINTDLQKSVLKCGKCSDIVNKSTTGIQCTSCKLWYHYLCTQLPPYQLFVYEKSQRRYTCKVCSGVTDEYLAKYNFYEIEKSTTKVSTSTSCIQTESPIPVEKSVQTECNLPKDDLAKNTIDKYVIEIENKFVDALDKISTSQNANFSKLGDIVSLRSENESLKKKIDCMSVQIPSQQPKCNCNNVKREMDNVIVEKDTWRKRFSDLSLQKELEMAQCETDIKILKQQLNCTENQLRIVTTEFEGIEKRIAIKTDTTVEMEKMIQDQKNQIIKLEDEIHSWKLHASRADDSLLHVVDDVTFVKNSRSPIIQQTSTNFKLVGETSEDKPIQDKDVSQPRNSPIRNQERTEDSNKLNNETTREKTVVSKTHQNGSKPRTPNRKQPPRTQWTTDSRKKSVLLVGTSNTKFVGVKYLSSNKVTVNKMIKYTMAQAKHYFLESKDVRPDVIILHLFGNDIKDKTAEECIEEMDGLINAINFRHPQAKVVISLGLPQADNVVNNKVEKLNALAKEKFSGVSYISICDNSNLSYRGRPARGILVTDGIHLTKLGTYIFSGNLKDCIVSFPGFSDVRRSLPNMPRRPKPQYGYNWY